MDVVAEAALHFCRAVELLLVGVGGGEKTELSLRKTHQSSCPPLPALMGGIRVHGSCSGGWCWRRGWGEPSEALQPSAALVLVPFSLSRRMWSSWSRQRDGGGGKQRRITVFSFCPLCTGLTEGHECHRDKGRAGPGGARPGSQLPAGGGNTGSVCWDFCGVLGEVTTPTGEVLRGGQGANFPQRGGSAYPARRARGAPRGGASPGLICGAQGAREGEPRCTDLGEGGTGGPAAALRALPARSGSAGLRRGRGPKPGESFPKL